GRQRSTASYSHITGCIKDAEGLAGPRWFRRPPRRDGPGRPPRLDVEGRGDGVGKRAGRTTTQPPPIVAIRSGAPALAASSTRASCWTPGVARPRRGTAGFPALTAPSSPPPEAPPSPPPLPSPAPPRAGSKAHGCTAS